MSQFSQGAGGPVLRPMDLGQLLDRCFKVFGQSWKPLVTVGLFAAIPGVIMSLFTLSLSSIDASVSSPIPSLPPWAFGFISALEQGDFSAIVALAGTMGLLAVGLWLLVPLYTGALVDVTARAALGMEPVPVMESIRIAAGNYWRLLGTALLAILLYIGGIIAFTLAGLVILAIITVPLGLIALGTFLMFTNHVIIVEGVGGGGAAISRTFSLVKTRFWPLLGYSIVFTIMVSIVSSMITLPLSFATGIVAAMGESLAMISVLYLVQGLVVAITTPFLMLGRTLMYFDTRIRREGFDLQMMAQQQAPPHDPFR